LEEEEGLLGEGFEKEENLKLDDGETYPVSHRHSRSVSSWLKI